ncbi:hypothetical protein K443DRAFT_671431, partial [Laccaria amethystina LaAM-08-1]
MFISSDSRATSSLDTTGYNTHKKLDGSNGKVWLPEKKAAFTESGGSVVSSPSA